MKKLVKSLLSTMVGGTLMLSSTLIQAAVPVLQLAANKVSQGKVVTQGGSRLRYYPNHQMSAGTYNKDVLRDMLALSQRLGWKTLYIQDLPPSLRGYAKQYFSNNDIALNVLSDDSYVIYDSQQDQNDMDYNSAF